MKKVEIHWVDSSSSVVTWVSKGSAKRFSPINCVSVGYLIKKNKRHFTIAQGASDSGYTHGVFSIPASAIKKVVEL